MIKQIAKKIFHNRALLMPGSGCAVQSHCYRFSNLYINSQDPDEDATQQKAESSIVQPVEGQIQVEGQGQDQQVSANPSDQALQKDDENSQQSVEVSEQNQAIEQDQEQDDQQQQYDQDEQGEQGSKYQIVNHDSNWQQLADFVNTRYYFNKEDPELQRQVLAQLQKHEEYIDFDLTNLKRLGINKISGNEILRKNYEFEDTQSLSLLPNHLSQKTDFGINLYTDNRIKELIEGGEVEVLSNMYRNQLFKNVCLPFYTVNIIIKNVIQSNFKTAFLLNLIQFVKNQISEKRSQQKQKLQKSRPQKTQLMKMSKQLEDIFGKISNLKDVNKLAWAWGVGTLYAFRKKQYPFVLRQVVKVSIKMENEEENISNLANLQTEKQLNFIYHSRFGEKLIGTAIHYSLRRFKQNYSDFIKFWALFNALIQKIVNVELNSIKNSSILNNIFQLIEVNFSENISKQIITQLVPQVLYNSKEQVIFEFYRQNANNWIGQRSISQKKLKQTRLDKFIRQRTQANKSITILYNGWKESQSKYACNCEVQLFTTTRHLENPDSITKLIDQQKVIEDLLKEKYNTVLNHFLLHNLPNLNKRTDVKIAVSKIFQEADELQFIDEDARALYLLKQLKKILSLYSRPVFFEDTFLQQYKAQTYQIIDFEEEPEQIPINQLQPGKKLFTKTTPQPEKKHFTKRFLSNNNQGKMFSKNSSFMGSTNNTQKFCTQKDSYAEYRNVVKALTQESSAQNQAVEFKQFKFAKTDLAGFEEQVEAQVKEITATNHLSLFKQNQLPVVGQGKKLLKYLFLKQTVSNEVASSPVSSSTVQSQILKKKLHVEFESEIGTLEKNYSEYLTGCRFAFALAPDVYISLLSDLKERYIRRNFKVIVSHIIAYRQEITSQEIQLICDICKRNRIGITLIEIYNLIINNKIVLQKQSIYILCQTVQKFRSINKDLFFMTKKYCDQIKIPFEIKMMSSYIRSLLLEEDDQRLEELSEIIKNQLRMKNYKVNSQLSTQQNLKRQKQYKKQQMSHYNTIIYEIIDIIVLNLNKKIPNFVQNIFNEYTKNQVNLSPNEKALSLIVYCNEVSKFLEVVEDLRQNPSQVVPLTYECWLKAGSLNIRGLQVHVEEVFNVVLFVNNFVLNEEQILKTLKFFKSMQNPTVFIKFLEYCLRYDTPMNQEIRHDAYFVMNSMSDDFAKSKVNGLLDFIFNTNRQKERIQYRQAQIAEEQKAKIIKDLDSKQVKKTRSDKIENFEDSLLNNQAGPKTQSSPANSKGKENASKKAGKAKVKEKKKTPQKEPKQKKLSKKERRQVSRVSESEVVIMQKSEPGQNLKRPSQNAKKTKNVGVNNFMQIFTSAQETTQQAPEEKSKKGNKGNKGAKVDAEKNKKNKKK